MALNVDGKTVAKKMLPNVPDPPDPVGAVALADRNYDAAPL